MRQLDCMLCSHHHIKMLGQIMNSVVFDYQNSSKKCKGNKCLTQEDKQHTESSTSHSADIGPWEEPDELKELWHFFLFSPSLLVSCGKQSVLSQGHWEWRLPRSTVSIKSWQQYNVTLNLIDCQWLKMLKWSLQPVKTLSKTKQKTARPSKWKVSHTLCISQVELWGVDQPHTNAVS